MYAYVVFLLHWMHWMHTGAAAAACFQITAQASASRWQSRSSSSGAEIWGHESGRVHHLLRLLWRNLMDATYISVFCHGFSKDLPTLHLYPCWSVFLGCTAIIDICQSHVLSSLAMTSLIHPDTDSHTVVSNSSRVLSHTASRQKLHLHMWTLFLWIFTLPNRWLWAFWRRTGKFQECTECPTYRGRPEGSGPMRKLREMQQV